MQPVSPLLAFLIGINLFWFCDTKDITRSIPGVFLRNPTGNYARGTTGSYINSPTGSYAKNTPGVYTPSPIRSSKQDLSYDALAMELLPQVLCSESGECIIPEESQVYTQDPEIVTIWDKYYDEPVQTPSHTDEDPWYELVANRLHPFPPLKYNVKTETPVTNIVRLPNRRVIRPYVHRPNNRPYYLGSSTSRVETTLAPNSAITQRTISSTPQVPSPTKSSAISPIFSNVVMLKMLLLIAFVAAPIVAATIPILLPNNQMSRSRRDDAIVNWATHSATLIALAHLATDDRLPELLRLQDDAFVEALSDVITMPLEMADVDETVDDEKIERTKLEIGKAVLKLIHAVKAWEGDWSSEDDDNEADNEHLMAASSNAPRKLIDFFLKPRTII